MVDRLCNNGVGPIAKDMVGV